MVMMMMMMMIDNEEQSAVASRWNDHAFNVTWYTSKKNRSSDPGHDIFIGRSPSMGQTNVELWNIHILLVWHAKNTTTLQDLGHFSPFFP